jgi:class 3 adenylate cyclase
MKPSPNPPPISGKTRDRAGKELETAILFVDLVNSSDFASILKLKEFAAYVDAFEEVCERQCQHFFEIFHKGDYQRGRDYDWEFAGDELAVFVHTGSAANDVYQLLCLALTLKCGWLGATPNRVRIDARMPAAELGAGVHIGPVWATPKRNGYRLRGAAISTAKRIETASRGGERFRIFVSDIAFRVLAPKAKHVLFSPRQIHSMKGIVLPVAVREVQESFMDLSKRLAPECADTFRRVARKALKSATYDGWIHSCLQVWEEKVNGNKVTRKCMEMCRNLLLAEPANAVALYHAAQYHRERKNYQIALHYLEDLTHCLPKFPYGWLEMSRVLKLMGRPDTESHHAILQARRHGITRQEETGS